ncbi:ATP-binding cassette domain-containing protein [Formosa sediminum]|uniref:ATP-binding cassette domain-containing protein n=1 Tax=Formosa sediminum TaxID=2594004 RepID=A0A516GSV6_9FLAO|nr:ATP-binding cassette domain-containing protein [Formosa sediminum]QDO94460.1 ATP-binding cassette domain-containing protein [Formosa sediminum]
MIKTNNLVKHYGDNVVVDQVNLNIPKGKITSLIGSNGAGKSTLLGAIARLIEPNQGAIIINDKNIKAYKDRILAQELSILKQINHLDLKLTVKELVGFGRFPYSQGRLTAQDTLKIEEAIAFLNLTVLQDNYLDELSGGQRQRAFLAMVVAQDTDYILLDEPLNNLDMKHSVQIMKTLKRLSEDHNKTIVMVVHDINFAAQYSDYIAAMKAGQLIHFDSTPNIITPTILKDIYDIDFEIIETNNKRICNYYN